MQRKITALSLILTFITAFSIAKAEPLTVTIGYMDFDKPPLWKTDGSGQDLDLVRAAAKQVGVEVKLKPLPWKRCQRLLAENQLDGILGASFKKSRMEIGQYPMSIAGKPDETAALHMDGYSFYKKVGDPVDYDGERFTGLTGNVGTNQGFSIVAKLKKRGITVYDEAKTTEQNLKMLAAGRYQVVADSRIRGDHYLDTHPEVKDKVSRISTPYGYSGRYLIFSHGFIRDYPEIAEAIWSSIREKRRAL